MKDKLFECESIPSDSIKSICSSACTNKIININHLENGIMEITNKCILCNTISKFTIIKDSPKPPKKSKSAKKKRSKYKSKSIEDFF